MTAYRRGTGSPLPRAPRRAAAKGRPELSSWSGYIATRYVESSEYILTCSRCASRASPSRSVHTRSRAVPRSSRSPACFSLPPPPSHTLSLLRYHCRTSPRPRASRSPPLLDLATQIDGPPSLPPTLLHEITSLPLDFTSGENMPVRSPGNLRPCALALAPAPALPAPLLLPSSFFFLLGVNLRF